MEAVYKSYKPAWKSFYWQFMLMILLVICGCAMNYVKPAASWTKWVWIAIAIVDAVIFFYVLMKRLLMSLVLRDDPGKAENQEVAFITCHPFTPANFRESIEIGLANIVHIKVKQSMMQSMLNVGDIVITSSGTGTEEIVAHNIPNPNAVRDEIQVHARKYTMPGA